MTTALAIARQLLLFTALISPLEILWPARRGQARLRRGAVVDFIYFALNPFIINVLGALILALVATALSLVIPDGARQSLRAQPFWLQLFELVFLAELGGYWVHRLSHEVSWLWRFHAVHHSVEELDWLAAHRQHPLEAAWLLGVANLPALLLGFSTAPLAAFILFQKLYTAFLHANVRLSFGRLSSLLASPRFHHWHHDRELAAGSFGKNYSSFLPLFDRLFGTFELPPGFPARYGSDTPMRENYLAQLVAPLRAQ
jgi:sterol desaturase/sphingolipid hydroxylase (fatty acid hydroxylase superfamily)